MKKQVPFPCNLNTKTVQPPTNQSIDDLLKKYPKYWHATLRAAALNGESIQATLERFKLPDAFMI